MYYQYRILEEVLFHPDIGTYLTFGIQCYLQNPKKLVAALSDISTDKAFVQNLAQKFTDGQLYPIHLLDVIEDALLMV